MSMEKFNNLKKTFPIGQRLAAYLKYKNVKPVELVRKTGISAATISEAINGKRDLTGTKIELIIRHTDIDPVWLLTGEGKMTRPMTVQV